jgi:hypothetical protein
MAFFISLSVAYLLAIAAFVIIAVRIFYPHHRSTALVIYIVSWILFIYSLWLRKSWLQQHGELIRGVIKNYGWYILLFLLLLGFVYIALIIFPARKSSLTKLTKKDLAQMIDQDAKSIQYLDSRLDGHIQDMLDSKAFKSTSLKQLSFEEEQFIRNTWHGFVEATFELDQLKNKYITFYQINVLRKPKMHSLAFLNGYAALIAQYTKTLKLCTAVNENELLETIYNQEDSERAIPQYTYIAFKQKLTQADEILRLNAGRGYFDLMKKHFSQDDELKNIVIQGIESIDSSLKSYPELLVNNPLELIEKRVSTAWFPMQKKVALQLSYIHTSTRDALISPKKIRQYQDRLLPGDILLQRREWHATNLGIPGYWTHLALYVGTLKQMNRYFAGIKELEGKSVSQFLKEKYPQAYNKLRKRNNGLYWCSVIEAIRDGVVLTPLEVSAHCDSIGALRAKVKREDRFKAVTTAITHLGKPYDYNFDFRIDNALVCSEVIYRSYRDIDGLTLKTVELNGRPMLPPNSIAEKFDKEYGTPNQELELVIFLDGNEKTRKIIERDVAEFRKSWQRPKWHILTNYLSDK